MTSITLLTIVIGLGSITPAAFAGAPLDEDGDGIPDGEDNCPEVSNEFQEDADGDEIGDACDPFFDITGDIKFDSDPNSVNCKNNKGLLKSVVPIVFFGSADFDATTIDVDTIFINGEGQTEKHGKIHLEDLNEDFIDDAVVHLIKKQVCDSVPNDLGVHIATVTATGGVTVGFVDSINIVQIYIGDGGGGGGDVKTAKAIAQAEIKAQKTYDKFCDKISGDLEKDKKERAKALDKINKILFQLDKKGIPEGDVPVTTSLLNDLLGENPEIPGESC